jgi:thiol:disulfide interchange protein DsbA
MAASEPAPPVVPAANPFLEIPMRRLLTLAFLALGALGATGAAQAAVAPAIAPEAATATPRPGLDFDVIAAPLKRFAPAKQKIEVAEVFSYACIHCAHFQPAVDAWLKKKPADVQWEYVPAVFGGPFTSFAAAYYAADEMGIRARSHSAVFKAVFDEKAVKTGDAQGIAALYARWGVDPAKFVAAMDGPSVRAKLETARRFAVDSGVAGTPTLIVNGKYRIQSTTDRSFPGMLHTLDMVIARERKGLPPPKEGEKL